MENNENNNNVQPVQAAQGTSVTSTQPMMGGIGFGITSETRGTGYVNIPAPVKLTAPDPQFPTGYRFPVVNLVKISFNPKKEITRNQIKEETVTLEFLFKDSKDRQFTHVEFPIDTTDEKFQSKLEWLNQRIMHIWTELLGVQRLPQGGIGTTATNFTEYFEQVANAFNSIKFVEGEKEKVLYPFIPIYLKLTFNQDRPQLPMFPNFIQSAKSPDGKIRPVEILTINPTHDKIEPTAVNKPKANNPYSGGGTNADFGAGATGGDFSTFPEV